MTSTNAALDAYRLGDAHCHPQLDPSCFDSVNHLKACHLAVMGVCTEDWDAIEQLQRQAPGMIIPAFGVHPWKVHQYTSSAFSTGSIRCVLQNPPDPQPGDDPCLDSPLIQGWEVRLEEKLQVHAGALVGECGLDRAARVPETRSRTCLTHQLKVLAAHLHLAAMHARPVSLHCVRADGAMHDVMTSLQRDLDSGGAAPPRIMLHSFQGSPDMVARMVAIGGGGVGSLGARIFFSVSCGCSASAGSRVKLLARVRAMPDGRILTESDATSVADMDSALAESVRAIAKAKGWSIQDTTDRVWTNHLAFFEGFLPGVQ